MIAHPTAPQLERSTSTVSVLEESAFTGNLSEAWFGRTKCGDEMGPAEGTG